MMALPADVQKALLAVLADQDLRTEVRELLDIDKTERPITLCNSHFVPE